MPIFEDKGGKYFEYRHIVSFRETNLVGNVYYANHILWQGKCRELFLYEYAPEILANLQSDLALVTVHVSCEYLSELFAFDQVLIHMRLGEQRQNRMTLRFTYWRELEGQRTLIARGQQQVAAMRQAGKQMQPIPFPKPIMAALKRLQVVPVNGHW